VFGVTFVSRAKTAESIEMPFGVLTRVGKRNHVLDGAPMLQGRGNFWGLSTQLKSTGALQRCTRYAKTAEPIEMPFGLLTLVGPRKHVLDEGQGRTNSFAIAKGDKTAMRPFVNIL